MISELTVLVFGSLLIVHRERLAIEAASTERPGTRIYVHNDRLQSV